MKFVSQDFVDRFSREWSEVTMHLKTGRRPSRRLQQKWKAEIEEYKKSEYDWYHKSGWYRK